MRTPIKLAYYREPEQPLPRSIFDRWTSKLEIFVQKRLNEMSGPSAKTRAMVERGLGVGPDETIDLSHANKQPGHERINREISFIYLGKREKNTKF